MSTTPTAFSRTVSPLARRVAIYAAGIVARALEIAEGAENRSEKQSRNGTRAVQMGLFK